MLTIGKLGIGQENYYLDKVAEGAEDYYSGEGEAEGRWMGGAAEELGLEGEVGPDQLKTMLTGRNPMDGEPLVGMRGVPAKGAVPGFDLTFSAPKSVSLLWALGGAETGAEVSRAHERSVEAALGYMHREACWTRRGTGGSEFVKGNGYLAAAYLHRSSRNGDPQLHTHVLIANATRGPDGRWTRLYHPAIYDHAKTAGSSTRSSFATRCPAASACAGRRFATASPRSRASPTSTYAPSRPAAPKSSRRRESMPPLAPARWRT